MTNHYVRIFTLLTESALKANYHLNCLVWCCVCYNALKSREDVLVGGLPVDCILYYNSCEHKGVFSADIILLVVENEEAISFSDSLLVLHRN